MRESLLDLVELVTDAGKERVKHAGLSGMAMELPLNQLESARARKPRVEVTSAKERPKRIGLSGMAMELPLYQFESARARELCVEVTSAFEVQHGLEVGRPARRIVAFALLDPPAGLCNRL